MFLLAGIIFRDKGRFRVLHYIYIIKVFTYLQILTNNKTYLQILTNNPQHPQRLIHVYIYIYIYIYIYRDE